MVSKIAKEPHTQTESIHPGNYLALKLIPTAYNYFCSYLVTLT